MRIKVDIKIKLYQIISNSKGCSRKINQKIIQNKIYSNKKINDQIWYN
jgi:hypothetical protein